MSTKRYTVTKLAGPKVAGRPATAGETLELTEAEAEHELLTGAITPEGQELPAAFTDGSRKLDKIQANAGGAGLTDPGDPPGEREPPPAGGAPKKPVTGGSKAA